MKEKPKLKEIYAEVEQIWAKKGTNSLWPRQPFKHKFERGVKLFGVKKSGSYQLKEGDILMRSRKGKLWKDFSYTNSKGTDMQKEPFLKKAKENPPGALFIVGANPPKKSRKQHGTSARKRKFSIGRTDAKSVKYTKGGRSRVGPKAQRRGANFNPLGSSLVTIGGNPMSRYYHFSKRRKSNPVKLGFRGMTEVKQWAPLAVWGALSATATGMVPGMLGLTGTWMRAGGQLATAFIGGMVVRQMWNKEAGNIWAVVGASLVMYDFLRDWVFARFFPELPLGDYSGYEEANRADSQSVGQYGDMDAYPEEVAAFPNEVGSYPYDGNYPY